MKLYSGARTSIIVNGLGSKDFEVNVCVHQGSVLSLLLKVLSKKL